LLFTVFLVSGAFSLRQDSATFDETAHIAAGFTYLDRLEFRLNPEHPPLAKAWAAMPVWLGGQVAPDYGSEAWRGRSILPGATLRSKADQWTFGFEFLNGPRASRERRDPARVLVPARLAILLLGLLLGVIVFAWARELWGSQGALLSLFLYCLSPTILAHSRLVTTDLPAALGFTATLWAFWRFTRQPDLGRGAAVGAALSLALLVKFSALLLLPLLMALGWLWVRLSGIERWQRSGRFARVLYVVAAALAVGYAGIWAGYGFRYLATTDPEYQLDWDVVGLKDGPFARLVHGALDRRILPQAYLYGLAYFLGGAERRLAFLNGEESLVGWWYYFPEAFLLKTPPALILLLVWTLVLGLRRHRLRSFDGWYLALPVLVYLGLSMASRLNIGHRHLVAIEPLLVVAAGGVAWFRGPQPADEPATWGRILRAVLAATIAALLGGYAASFAVATPRYLSYFNVLAGGARGGWRYLLDSNIDWGQDLGRLKALLDRRGIEEVNLAYFGTADPRAYGIRYRKVYLVHDFYPEEPVVVPRSGDYLAVSVNLLQGLYYDRDGAFANGLLRRGWVPQAKIDEWVAERDRRSRRGQRHPGLADWLVAQAVITEAQQREVDARLLSTWLARIRDTLEPLDKAGDSIFLYRLP
jgi:4-amino-4-deoxy-L-arabinose transferase-like glycosyltransferase